MFFLVTGDDSSVILWHKAIYDAMRFRTICKSYYLIHPNPKIRSEILKIIHDLECDDFCELLEHDDFGSIHPEFMIYSISSSHEFYDFCVKCHEDSAFAKSLKIANIHTGEAGFYDKKMSNKFLYEILIFFCIAAIIVIYLVFFYK